MYDGRSIYQVTNTGTKSNYLIVDDEEYCDLQRDQRKVQRTPAIKRAIENRCVPCQRRIHPGFRIQSEREIHNSIEAL
jgi:hypothetical protein